MYADTEFRTIIMVSLLFCYSPAAAAAAAAADVPLFVVSRLFVSSTQLLVNEKTKLANTTFDTLLLEGFRNIDKLLYPHGGAQDATAPQHSTRRGRNP